MPIKLDKIAVFVCAMNIYRKYSMRLLVISFL